MSSALIAANTVPSDARQAFTVADADRERGGGGAVEADLRDRRAHRGGGAVGATSARRRSHALGDAVAVDGHHSAVVTARRKVVDDHSSVRQGAVRVGPRLIPRPLTDDDIAAVLSTAGDTSLSYGDPTAASLAALEVVSG